jgi:hypothetical protein
MLLKTNTDDEPKPEFVEPAQAVARVKKILFSGAEGISPNLSLSPTDGESLLFLAVTKWFLDEWKVLGEQPMLDLVKILLQAGADPNLENVVDRDTALDHMDFEIEFSELTAEQSEIIRLLTKAGAKVLPRNYMGRIVGERGEGISLQEKARQQAMSTLLQCSRPCFGGIDFLCIIATTVYSFRECAYYILFCINERHFAFPTVEKKGLNQSTFQHAFLH